MSRDIALYIHVPFCRRKCRYCSFVSYEGRERDIPLYLEALKSELKQRSNGESIRSVYLGGGTPSLLPAESISDIFTSITGLFTLDKGAEITIEANPGTIDGTYLERIREAGVNRLSIGVQSFNDRELKMLGRIHTVAEAMGAVHSARRAGFDNLNLDLIYGLPGQTKEDWRRSLEEALALAPEHLSLYALTLEEDAPMYKTIKEGRLPEIDPDLSAGMYELAEDTLEKRGYKHYEISNWAVESRECRHNLTYWRNLTYLGFGPAAHSSINGHRLANCDSLDKYIAGFYALSRWTPETDEIIRPGTELAETIILGLRLGEGVKTDNLNKRFGINIFERYRWQIREMRDAGLLRWFDGNMKLTRRGRLLSNEVFWRFLPE